MFGFSFATPGTVVQSSQGGGVNQLPDSWQFEAAAWGGVNANIAVSSGQADPFGGARGSTFLITGGGSQYAQKIQGGLSITGGSVVLSVYYKVDAANRPSDGSLRLYNQTRATLCMVSHTWSPAGAAFTYGVQGPSTTGGAIPVGGGWYRIWVSVDISANIAGAGWSISDVYRAQLSPWGGDTTLGHYLYVAAVQLEPGISAGPYLEKP